MRVEDARSLFPVLQRFVHLNAGSLGPLSQATLDAMDARARFDDDHGRAGVAWYESMFTLRTRVRELLAAAIGSTPERLALTSSTTDGCNIVLSGLDLKPEDEVVTTDAEHPGLLLPLHASGARVVVAEVGARPTARALDTILASITPKTRLLALSHVLWTTGRVMPVHELMRESGLPVLVDGAQSVGAIPVDVGELDYYTVSCQKWLCGPETLGALYVRDPDALRVAIPSYFSQQKIERDGSFVPTDGAARFDSRWLALPALAGLQAALEQAPEWRFDRAAEITAHCREKLAEQHEVIGDPPLGTLVAFVPRTDPAETALRLYERGVIVREMPGTGWMRVSCGWWTSEDDVERLVRELSAA